MYQIAETHMHAIDYEIKARSSTVKHSREQQHHSCFGWTMQEWEVTYVYYARLLEGRCPESAQWWSQAKAKRANTNVFAFDGCIHRLGIQTNTVFPGVQLIAQSAQMNSRNTYAASQQDIHSSFQRKNVHFILCGTCMPRFVKDLCLKSSQSLERLEHRRFEQV